MDPSTKRNFQIALVLMLLLAGARTLWIFHERSESSMPEKPAAKERNEDDYVYLRPSHAHDLASARAVLKGQTVWVKAGNAVAYYAYTCPTCYNERAGTLPPIAALAVKDVVMSGDQMMAVFCFASGSSGASDPSSPPAPAAQSASSTTQPKSSVPQCLRGEKASYAAPIGVVKRGEREASAESREPSARRSRSRRSLEETPDATILIDDIFFLSDPHTLYKHWSKDAWSAIERHEITQGMSEMQAQAAMGIGRAPESGAPNDSGADYGNRTLVFTDPAHPDKPVTVKFVDNAAVSISH